MSSPTYNLLIVEDNETMQEGMVRVVEKIGHRAVQTTDAEQALVQLNQQAFHLMISDYKLPGMDGLQLLTKTTLMFPDMAVLIITAYGTIELAVEAMQKGATDFITKPFSPEELTLNFGEIVGNAPAWRQHRPAVQIQTTFTLRLISYLKRVTFIRESERGH